MRRLVLALGILVAFSASGQTDDFEIIVSAPPFQITSFKQQETLKVQKELSPIYSYLHAETLNQEVLKQFLQELQDNKEKN